MRIIRRCFWIIFLVFSMFGGCTTDVTPPQKDSSISVTQVDSIAVPKNDSIIHVGEANSQEMVSAVNSSESSVEKVNVMVSSHPTGAEVYVDGKSTGSITDSLLWNLKGGKHILEYRLPGFKPAFLPVILKGKGIQQLQTVKLVKNPDAQGRVEAEISLHKTSPDTLSEASNDSLAGTLSIVVEPKFADVFIDDKKIKERPISIESKSGSYEVTCCANGYFSRTLRALVRSGKTENIRIQLERKEDALSLKRLSETYRDMGNLPQAIEHMRKAIALEPKVAVLHIELINLSLRSGQTQSALVAAQRANILFFDNEAITYLYGLALFQTGKVRDALPLLEKSVIASPRNKTRLESLAVCYEGLKLWEKTLEIADRLVALGDKTGEFYNLRGFCLSNLGRYKEAIDAFGRAIAISPEKITFKLNAASAHKSLQEDKD